ncbi:MAG TPA: hypothetical protein VFN10_08755 [Thermoanaerobaculia bacterium]|nr:hypothetical protein [Thermoanaerobaculia bacterium]
MRKTIFILSLLLLAAVSHAATFATGAPSTTNNDDSCDIALLPAATLLLPYFEVEVAAPPATAATTLFTIVNVTQQPQIAHVTLWTDLAYPVLTFNIFLTGYDVQAINLYDVIVRGQIAPLSGTSNATTPGARSLSNTTGNPRFADSAATNCSPSSQGGGVVPALLVTEVRKALTAGMTSSCPNAFVGEVHDVAAGYATIDLVSTCSAHLPSDAAYYGELLYDNVLTGDYQYINPNATTGNYAGGNPLVHIRAIPEGGAAGQIVGTDLPYTFYDRLTPAETRRIDRRQPLPSTFAARFIDGGPTSFQTDFNIWREALTGTSATCLDYERNGPMEVADLVRFDERENPTELVPLPILDPPLPGYGQFRVTSRTNAASYVFPSLSGSGDVGGWMYLSLNNLGSDAYSVAANFDYHANSSSIHGPRQSQNWVTVSMFAEGRYSTLTDATMLANGCTRSPASPLFAVEGSTVPPIGPGPNVVP